MFAYSDYSSVSILYSMSAWLTQSCIQYSVNVRPLRLFLYVNTLFHVRLIQIIVYFSIELMFGYSDHCSVSIFHSMSAGFPPSSIQYWVDIRPLRLFLRVNILFHVHLIYKIIHSVFSQCSITPIIPLCQYTISCSPDSNNRSLSIELMFSHSDHSSLSILHPMSAGHTQSSIQY
jgi:hypothetical protein